MFYDNMQHEDPTRHTVKRSGEDLRMGKQALQLSQWIAFEIEKKLFLSMENNGR